MRDVHVVIREQIEQLTSERDEARTALTEARARADAAEALLDRWMRLVWSKAGPNAKDAELERLHDDTSRALTSTQERGEGTPVPAEEPVTCAKCGIYRIGVTPETFVCRFCLGTEPAPPAPLVERTPTCVGVVGGGRSALSKAIEAAGAPPSPGTPRMEPGQRCTRLFHRATVPHEYDPDALVGHPNQHNQCPYIEPGPTACETCRDEGVIMGPSPGPLQIPCPACRPAHTGGAR